MRDVVIVEAARSAVGKRNGALARTHPIDMLGPVQQAVVERAGIDPREIGQVVGGVIDQVGAQAANITRTAWLAAGLPQEVAATTVDSQCGSSQQAVNLATALIASGVVDVAMACGVENMSTVPIGGNARAGAEAGYGRPINRTYGAHYEYTSQFEGAERIATKYGITREDTEHLGLASQERARPALGRGTVRAADRAASGDPGRRGRHASRRDRHVQRRRGHARDEPRGTGEAEAGRRDDGVHTAGTSSQISDGAAAVLLMTSEKASDLGLTPTRARRRRRASSAVTRCSCWKVRSPRAGRCWSGPGSPWTTST